MSGSSDYIPWVNRYFKLLTYVPNRILVILGSSDHMLEASKPIENDMDKYSVVMYGLGS